MYTIVELARSGRGAVVILQCDRLRGSCGLWPSAVRYCQLFTILHGVRICDLVYARPRTPVDARTSIVPAGMHAWTCAYQCGCSAQADLPHICVERRRGSRWQYATLQARPYDTSPSRERHDPTTMQRPASILERSSAPASRHNLHRASSLPQPQHRRP